MGVQARERQPAEPPAPLRRRAASDGQYENQSPEATSPRSPGVRSPVQCVSPELALTIALNPGGRPKEDHVKRSLSSGLPSLCPSVLRQPHLHSYKEAFEEMERTSPSGPPSSGAAPAGQRMLAKGGDFSHKPGSQSSSFSHGDAMRFSHSRALG
ncbi:hypothetical protein U0070_022160 [Myodes glareolus]|uniref:Uncharacterized protein n=1 Tax=Myodes glareolus TaxID=447135 RepID=A0AAW0IPX3_MYOGA